MSVPVSPDKYMTSPIPACAGIGLRPLHYADILSQPPKVGWIEVHPENYLTAGGPQHRALTAARQIYPLSFHGVGLSLGGLARPDPAHLARLRVLIARYQPALFSEHLAWSSHGGAFMNDLLPIPYTEAALDRLVAHVDETQECIGRQILIENPSLYLRLQDSDMRETEFLRELTARSGCGLLLDINNVHVSARNCGFDSGTYLADYPLDHVREIHLAGHMAEVDDGGAEVLIDAHNTSVSAAVWALYRWVVRVVGPLPTLIEWDQDLPDWRILLAEAASADRILAEEVPHADVA
ncbi:MAG: DUF692 domain-containing protein [Rhodospirillaceae bacterium]|nr:DUF692 domain-containing protein [Rhodospirillaceae bacterium]